MLFHIAFNSWILDGRLVSNRHREFDLDYSSLIVTFSIIITLKKYFLKMFKTMKNNDVNSKNVGREKSCMQVIGALYVLLPFPTLQMNFKLNTLSSYMSRALPVQYRCEIWGNIQKINAYEAKLSLQYHDP